MNIYTRRHSLYATHLLWDEAPIRLDVLYEGFQGEAYVWSIYEILDCTWYGTKGHVPFIHYVSISKL